MSPVHLHLILNHVPVIGTFFVLVVLLVALVRRSNETAKLGLMLIAGIALVTVVVFLTGEPAEERIEGLAGVSERLIHDHEEVAEAAFIATSISGVLALGMLLVYRRRELPPWATRMSLAAVIVVSGMMAYTANLGGQIRHSEIRSAATTSAGEVEERGEH